MHRPHPEVDAIPALRQQQAPAQATPHQETPPHLQGFVGLELYEGEAPGAAVDGVGVTQVCRPGVLLRLGAFQGLEFQAQLNSLILTHGGGPKREGFQDMGLRAKLHLLQSGPAGSSLSLLGSVSLSTGADFLTSDEAVPSFSSLADVPLSPGLGLAVNLGTDGLFADSGDRHLIEGGVTWLASADLQLDVNGVVDTESGDFFLGLGLATRWLF